MANTKSTNNLSFAFNYGFTEGKVHSREFTKLLKKAGYIPAGNPKSADIIIAHSAGCWYQLDGLSPKLLLYVGMPLPTNSVTSVWLESNKFSTNSLIKRGRFIHLAKSIAYNIMYLLRHPRRNLDIMRKAEHAMPIVFKDALTVFIVNEHDPWPQSERLNRLIKDEPWSFVGLRGAHNNLWHEPDNYVRLINHYARLLAKTDG